MQTAPVSGVIHSLDQSLRFQLVDDSCHCAQLNMKCYRQLAHCLRTVKVETPQAVGLGDGQWAVRRFLRTAKLVERGQTIQGFVEPN